ncbi:M12 family metallo-peptidase [Kordia sp.]|uniref:zinc-dependent metalloprotease n=1 Tax=Kordia sp. TaxID=1965332 RepID=UPI0025BFA856|nr:M12 family metallo-peptidase [Kordia sp.]MCH2192925.1 M12 family metallo-peptidase [Kordia sp.]
MKKKLVIVCICLLGCLFLSAQERRQGSIIENISKLKEANVQFEKIHFFEETSNARLSRQVQKDVKAFKLLNVSASALEQIHKTEERFFAVSVPLPDGSFAQLNLIESSHLIGDYTVRTSSGKQYTSIRNTITFLRGEVEHNGVKGIAVLTVGQTEISGMFSLPHLGNFSIGKMENEAAHIVYQDADIVSFPDFICEVEEGDSHPHKDKKKENATPKAFESTCIKVYIEAGFELFTNRGSVANSETYVISLFNQVAVLYQNENIAIDISEILVWDTDDPYADSDSADILSDFRSELDDNYVGDVAHLVDMDPGGNGGRARRDQLCDKDDAHAYSDVRTFIGTVPNYSWSVSVFAHEMGHTIGSRHTHDCVWGPNGNEQIDDCGSQFWNDIDDCDDDSVIIPPTNGGTIMSYCHGSGPGIGFALGFGDEPGDLLRDKVDDANCLGGCFPCDTTDSADFEIETYCENGTWKVSVTALDLDPQNHWWGLYQTDTQGEVGDGNTVDGPIGGIQNGLTASWGWLDQSKRYYIKHGIWSDFCYGWRERRIAIEPFYVEPADFKLENQNDMEKEVFCIGEDIWADGNATIGEGRYNIHAWRFVNGQKQWFGSIGWFYGNMTEVNISEEFAALDNPKYFTEGEYVLTIAFANLGECKVWTPVEKKFAVECCDDIWDASFFPATNAGSGSTYNISSSNFETYSGHNVIHEWYLLKSDGMGGYSPVTSSVGTISYGGAEYGVEYTLIHKLRTPCGEVCFARTIFISGRPNPKPIISTKKEVIDCDIIDSYFPCDIKTGKFRFDCATSEVSWGHQPNVDGYVLRVYLNQGECCETPLTQPSFTKYFNYTQNSYTIPNADDVECLTIQLGVICDGTVKWGQPFCRTCCRIEGPPTNLDYSCDTYWATFDPVAGADQYVIEVIWNDPDCFCFEGAVTTDTWNIGDRTQVRIFPRDERFHCFSFRIGAKCNGLSETIWSEKECSFCFDDPPIRAEQDTKELLNLLITPNPATSKVEFMVSTDQETKGEYIIRSFNGVIINRINDASQSRMLDISKYPKGIYFVQFISNAGHKSEVKKLIVK